LRVTVPITDGDGGLSMSGDQITIKFECLKCGGTVLERPDDYTDDSIAKCKSCGQEFGRFGDVKAKAMDVAKAEVRAHFKNPFKGLKSRKMK